jgi:stress-induced morphogen
MKREQVIAMILEQFPDAELALTDLTGTEDHYQLEIASARFVGLSMIKRHRLVYAALGDYVGREIHALALTTALPGERAAAGDDRSTASAGDSRPR